MNITSERLAYWFLRLNGFLTIENFVVHADEGVGQRTDVDVLGVRFPYRAENQIRPMTDHALFSASTRMQVVLVETKRTVCRLNRAWTDPAAGNLRRVLSAGGFLAPAQIDAAIDSLYADGRWEDATTSIALVAIGGQHNRDLGRGLFQRVPQVLWEPDILPFIHERFWTYRNEKRMHPQWDGDGHNLFLAAQESNGDLAGFIASVGIDGD